MTNKTDKTIRSLKRALKEMDYIEIENYLIIDELNIRRYAITRLDESKFQIKTLINELEEEYQVNHTIGAYRSD